MIVMIIVKLFYDIEIQVIIQVPIQFIYLVENIHNKPLCDTIL